MATPLDIYRPTRTTLEGLSDVYPEKRLFSARPVLTQLYQASMAAEVSPWSALTAVICKVLAATGPQVVLPPFKGSCGSLNLAEVHPGEVAQGKSSSWAFAASSVVVTPVHNPDGGGLAQTGLGETVMRNNIGSGEALARFFATVTTEVEDSAGKVTTERGPRHERGLFYVDEGGALATSAARSGATTFSYLTSSITGGAMGNLTSADDIDVPDGTYRACYVISTQLGNVGFLFEQEKTGLPHRFVWADPYTDIEDPDYYSDLNTSDAPDTYSDVGADLAQSIVSISLPYATMGTAELPRDVRGWSSPKAAVGGQQIIMQFPDRIRDIVRRDTRKAARGQAGNDGHRNLTKMKVAASLALMETRTRVTSEDWELAEIIMAHSDAVREYARSRDQDLGVAAEAHRMLTRNRATEVIEDGRAADVRETVIAKLRDAGSLGYMSSGAGRVDREFNASKPRGGGESKRSLAGEAVKGLLGSGEAVIVQHRLVLTECLTARHLGDVSPDAFRAVSTAVRDGGHPDRRGLVDYLASVAETAELDLDVAGLALDKAVTLSDAVRRGLPPLIAEAYEQQTARPLVV